MAPAISLILLFAFAGNGIAQDFEKGISMAKFAYSAGKLDETHFALQQAMQEVDMIIGKEVLKFLPANMEMMSVNTKYRNGISNFGFVGATIIRRYGKAERKADLTITSNFPMVAMINSVLNIPFMGGMMNDGKTGRKR